MAGISPATDADIDAVIALWTACSLVRRLNDTRADIALARGGANATVLVGRDEANIVAAALVGHDGHRSWVYYLAVHPQAQWLGHGGAIMRGAEQ